MHAYTAVFGQQKAFCPPCTASSSSGKGEPKEFLLLSHPEKLSSMSLMINYF